MSVSRTFLAGITFKIITKLSSDLITRKIKSDERLKDIPVIIVSASRKTESIARKIGANDFMCKPFDIEELEQVVREYTS